jgi:hypothetical protein
VKVQFRCIIAPISSALKFGGDAGGVTLEVPKSDIEKAVALIALQGVGLKVTVELDDSNLINKLKQNGSEREPIVEARTKRQSKWKAAEGSCSH